ncbi:unnamed protein product [Parnassius apollo]|uniref:(apollo) hypothetical protein n=1 Tax=Parnassius apollo TaxID=110799 RepID=A0A8S3WE99_PARAO|nr:unnamed protein product [Parnassius apollo]
MCACTRVLRRLGRAVRVRGHAGWAGRARTSYDAHAPVDCRQQPDHRSPPPDERTPAIYDGREQVLYWSDSTDEIAFIVPSGYEIADTEDRLSQSDSLKSYVDGPCLSTCSKGSERGGESVPPGGVGGQYLRSCSESERGEIRAPLADSARALSLDLDKQPDKIQDKQHSLTGSGRRNRDFTPKILIIWLEDFEDHLNLPIDELLRYCETGLPWRRQEVNVVCVSAIRSGLVRVHVGVPAGVLADGALLAPRALPACLRRAATHLARRSRLQAELYQPPHVRRRHMIQEIVQQYKKDLSEPELLESLFRPP